MKLRANKNEPDIFGTAVIKIRHLGRYLYLETNQKNMAWRYLYLRQQTVVQRTLQRTTKVDCGYSPQFFLNFTGNQSNYRNRKIDFLYHFQQVTTEYEDCVAWEL